MIVAGARIGKAVLPAATVSALVGVVAVVAAGGCSSGSGAQESSDAAGDDGGIPHRDSAAGGDGGGAVEGGADSPAHVVCTADRPFAPAYPWAPPSSPWPAGACTASQVLALVSDCLGSTGSPAACNAFMQDSNNAQCVGCAVSLTSGDAGPSTYGPILVVDTTTPAVLYVNFGGCIAHYDGNGASTGCGEKVQYLNDCIDFSCEDCPDWSTQGPKTQACAASAEHGVCVPYFNVGCIAETQAGGVAQTCSIATHFVGAWCGPLASDGGADASDAD
jgi:hypothetical protein